ncbi:MAG: AAA family ATPase [Dehalococcoidia bacterium]
MAGESIIGSRIAVVGSSGSGKTTVASQLAARLDLPFVELDALYWKPGWVGSNDEEFLGRVRAETAGEGWVVAGNYSRAWAAYWPRVDTVVWLDLPLRVCLARLVRRSWRRSRERELLWGTNVERFWPQLKVWAPNESLIAWTVTRRARLGREVMRAAMDDEPGPGRVVRLRSSEDVNHFVRLVVG